MSRKGQNTKTSKEVLFPKEAFVHATRSNAREGSERERKEAAGCARRLAIQWERENKERPRERPHDWGGSFRDALGVAAAVTTTGGRTESGQPAVGPGMIPAVSIYMRARGAHNLLAVCSGCAIQRGARVIVLHGIPDTVYELVGWLAGFSLRFSRELRTRVYHRTEHIRTLDRAHTRR